MNYEKQWMGWSEFLENTRQVSNNDGRTAV